MVAAPSDPYVAELLEDARKIARYGRYAGHFRDGRLFAALAAAEAVPDPKPGDDAVVKLHQALTESAEHVPFTTLVELKRNWPPEASRLRRLHASGRTWLLVGMSILLMVVVGQLTRVHNKGVAIAQELGSLAESDPRQDYNRLIRDLMQAREQFNEASLNASDTDHVELARNAYFANEADLINLSNRLANASRSAEGFSGYDVRFPLWGMRELWCLWNRPEPGAALSGRSLSKLSEFTQTCGPAPQPTSQASGDGVPPGEAAAAQPSPEPRAPAGSGPDLGTGEAAKSVPSEPGPVLAATAAPPQDATAPSSSRARQGQPAGACELGIDAQVAAEREGAAAGVEPSDPFRRYYGDVLWSAKRLACNNVISFLPGDFPPITTHLANVNSSLGLYALWLLPALYGAMGTVLFHMRRILDPLLPDPPLVRLAHRVVLGALAGIVLAWFFIPDTQLGTEIADIGVSLFGLAFLFGFSLNVFFAMLDKLVQVSEAGISRWGTAPRDK